MDKETLSNYGWIVVCVMVLAVMIALATPFGSFIKSGVENTTQGLFDTKQSAFEAAGIDIADQSFEGGSNTSTPTPEELIAQGVVPEGGTYYVGIPSKCDETTMCDAWYLGDYTGATATYTAGQTMPTISDGDVFVYGDYEYRYNICYSYICFESNPSQNGWGVKVLDDTKTEYGAILENINGQPITNINWTFSMCTALTTAPAIPSSVTDMWSTFDRCTNLTTAPVIPSSVTDMQETFRDCTSLTGNIEINATPTSYDMCFYDTTQPITLSGTSTKLAKLAATANNGNVKVAQ